MYSADLGCYFLSMLIVIYIIGPALSDGDLIDKKVLHVGEELQKESIPLRMGSRLYQLNGLKSHMWYEVKISYPASIPASFYIQLKKANSDLKLNRGRKLLNTEKLIFNTNEFDLVNDQGGMSVLVSVEPEGVVAIPLAKERENVIYNIVCDELILGIPEKAWYVVLVIVLCLGFALVLPSLLPPYLLPKNQGSHITADGASKES